MSVAGLTVDFCGELHPVSPERGFTIGRQADLEVDDNPFLHRRLIELRRRDALWWVANVGSQIALTLSDRDSRVQALLSPGSSIPLVFAHTIVRFSAGPALYEVDLHLSDSPYQAAGSADDHLVGDTTVAPMPLTPDQKLLLVALAERALRRGTTGVTSLPSSAEAAERLGWPLTTFNRKLDALCTKMTRSGVAGLHGDASKLASSRRAKLVEHALSVRLVTLEDLQALPPSGAGSASGPGGTA